LLLLLWLFCCLSFGYMFLVCFSRFFRPTTSKTDFVEGLMSREKNKKHKIIYCVVLCMVLTIVLLICWLFGDWCLYVFDLCFELSVCWMIVFGRVVVVVVVVVVVSLFICPCCDYVWLFELLFICVLACFVRFVKPTTSKPDFVKVCWTVKKTKKLKCLCCCFCCWLLFYWFIWLFDDCCL